MSHSSCVTTTDDTAAWARTEVRLGPLNRFRAVVIAPSDIPPIADDDRARPALAILGAITQARNRSPHAIDAAIQARRALPALQDDQQRVYWDVILGALDPQARAELEDWMFGKVEYTSDFARKYFAEGKAEGKVEGVAEGERLALHNPPRTRNSDFVRSARADRGVQS